MSAPAQETPQTIAHMRRMLAVGSSWHCVNTKFPKASGDRVVTSSKSTIRYDATKTDGTTVKGCYAAFPTSPEMKSGEVLLHPDRIQWFHPAGVLHHEWTRAEADPS